MIQEKIQDIGYMPRWSILLLDLLLCTVAFWLSVWIGAGIFHYGLEGDVLYSFGEQYAIVIGIQLIAFLIFRTYSGIIRFSTFVDMVKVLSANFSTGLVIIVFNMIMQYMTGNHPILNTVVLIYMPSAFVLLFSVRVAVKIIGEMIQHHGSGSPRVMIYGTKYAGVSIAKMLRSSGNVPYEPVGFIADGDERSGFDLEPYRNTWWVSCRRPRKKVRRTKIQLSE